MRLRACFVLLLFLSACASAPDPLSMPRPLVFAPTPRSGPSIRLVSAPMEPVQQSSRIGMADMEQARALLSRARSDLEPRQWDALDGKLTAAQRAFDRFSRAAKASGQAAEVSRGAEGFVRAGRARTFAEALPRVGPLLAVLALLYPSSTASAEIDRRPEWVDAQREYEVRLRELSEASRQLMVELEAQPRPAKAPARALWDVKTDGFDKHDSRSQDFFIQMKLPEIQREKRLAEACGYEFAVGVRSKAHQIALERADGTLKVVLMNWC